MCRFPGLLTVAGICVAVVIAILVGVAPATDVSAASPQPARTVVCVERPMPSLTPAELLRGMQIGVPTEPVARSFGQGKACTGGSRLLAEGENNAPLVGGMSRTPKQVPEVAMTGELDERGPPFRR